MTRTLSHEQARRFYDVFGSRQDWQAFYEDAAVRRLTAASELESARVVVEFGCGTGRLAARLLAGELPPEARYLGIDVSETMVALARDRLLTFGTRAEVRRSDGRPALPVADASYDRVLSTYVFDLLSEADIVALVADARRALREGGLACVASLTFGQGRFGRALERAWTAVHRLSPALMGGCRPIALAGFFAGPGWQIRRREVVAQLGLCSEVLVAATV